MPKQLYKIVQFHGGLNSNSDPRDIAENELSDATDIMVDELGKIRLMGGTAAHYDYVKSANTAAITLDIESGYGLFQFSHDRVNGHLGEHLASGGDFSTGSKWGETGDFTLDSTDASYEHSTGVGTLFQTAANRLEEGIVGVTYALTYTITNFSETIDSFQILGQDGVLTVDTIAHQEDHTNGTYSDVALTGGGSGAEATIVVAGNDVTSVKITNSGAGYTVNDTLTIPHATIGGSGAVTCDVATKTGDQFAASGATLSHANGTHITTFTSHASDVDKTITIDVKSTAIGEQISETDDRTFAGSSRWQDDATTANQWAEDSGTYNESASSGATENGFFADNYLKLVATSDASHVRNAYLDGANWEDDDGASGAAMVVGRIYRLSYSIEITAYTSGTLTVGFATADRATIDADYKKTYTATKSAATDTLDFVYDGTTNHAILIINASTSSAFTVYFDNFSIQELPKFDIDNVSLVIYDAAETGDNYLVMADDESNDPAVYIYSENQNLWSETQVLTIGSTNDFAPCFYYVDGALRVSDGNFGSSNINKWHGYIKETWFANIGSGFPINQWYQADQEIAPPGASYFQKDWTKTSGEEKAAVISAGTIDLAPVAAGAYAQVTEVNLKAALDTTKAVIRCVVNVDLQAFYPSASVSLTVKVGFWKDDPVWSGFAQEVEIADHKIISYTGTTVSHTFNFDPATTDMDGTTTATGSGTEYWRIECTSITEHSGTVGAYVISDSTVYEAAATTFPELDSGGSDFTNGYSTANNVCMLWGWYRTYLNATDNAWVPVANNGVWGIGATFIYDGVQESQLTELIDEDDGSTDGMNLNGLDGGNLVIGNRPAVAIAIADPTHDGDGDGNGTLWNKRVTGCNIYLKNLYSADASVSEQTSWILQYRINFLTGKLKVESTQSEYDALLKSDPTNQSYYYWFLDTTHSIAPSTVTTYEMNTGFDSTAEDFVSAYKTAVVANRMAYIGNVQVTKSDGSKEIRGDAMVKSSVGKFDTFPLGRLIEASVRDGDSIVKLEEYADRILQFKKNKMHIINVSQELEFLEDTFMHKGVSHPAATCKTDFGIAWVNKQGCYLYDGQKIDNLLEKAGRQIIKESEWDKFLRSDKSLTGTRLTPMIGYLPKKRQLIVFDDITTGSSTDPRMYLYDMVTQSWTKGSNDASNRVIDQVKTNFITDWNGDLVYAHTAGTVVKWDDAVDSSAVMVMSTKDIDFGQPGQLKNVYKVYLTYRGDARNVQVHYGKDGLAPALTFNDITSGTDGSSTGSGSNAKCIPYDAGVTDWLKAELKPSAAISNINSFRLKISANGSHSIAGHFEINDISIVFRLKGQR